MSQANSPFLSLSKRISRYRVTFNAIVILFKTYDPDSLETNLELTKSLFPSIRVEISLITPKFISLIFKERRNSFSDVESIVHSTFKDVESILFYSVPGYEKTNLLIRGQNYNQRLCDSNDINLSEIFTKGILVSSQDDGTLLQTIANFSSKKGD